MKKERKTKACCFSFKSWASLVRRISERERLLLTAIRTAGESRPLLFAWCQLRTYIAIKKTKIYERQTVAQRHLRPSRTFCAVNVLVSSYFAYEKDFLRVNFESFVEKRKLTKLTADYLHWSFGDRLSFLRHIPLHNLTLVTLSYVLSTIFVLPTTISSRFGTESHLLLLALHFESGAVKTGTFLSPLVLIHRRQWQTRIKNHPTRMSKSGKLKN